MEAKTTFPYGYFVRLEDPEWVRAAYRVILDKDELPASDRESMLLTSMVWRACKTAASVMVRDFEKLKKEAIRLISAEELALAAKN